jgi:hypothetical protein
VRGAKAFSSRANRALQGAVEAFALAVGLWVVGADAFVGDAGGALGLEPADPFVAVLREMPISAATCAAGRPDATRSTSSWRPKRVTRRNGGTRRPPMGVFLDSSTTSEVFSMIKTDECQQRP